MRRSRRVGAGDAGRVKEKRSSVAADRINATMHERAEAADRAFGEALEQWKRRHE
jgi:hypothetical protein